MATISVEIKEGIAALSKKELEKLVIKAASKDKSFYNYLFVNYFNKESGEQELHNKTKADLDTLIHKSYRGFSEELQLANMLSACVKRINEFSKVCKNKKFEVDLIMYVLEIPFSANSNYLGTCFTAFDYKVGLLVKRVITLLTKKLHPDYLIQYTQTINQYLIVLHRTSSHMNLVYSLPKTI